MTKNKPKVSTFINNSIERERRLLKLIEAYSPAGVTPLKLAIITKINENTIKSILKRLINKEQIYKKEGLHGFYAIIEENTHSLNEWNFQNGVLVFESDKIKIKETQTSSNKLTELIKYRFQISPKTKKASLHFSTDYPVSFSSIALLIEIFLREIEQYSDIKARIGDIYFSTIELNKDDYFCRLDGKNCLSFKGLISQYKLYQKENRVREEFKSTSRIDAEIIMRLLKQGVVAADVQNQIKDLKFTMNQLEHKFDKNMFTLFKEFSKLNAKKCTKSATFQ